MFARQFEKKQKTTSKKILGYITSISDYQVIVKLLDDTFPYRKGQRIILSIPNERKTALGKIVKVSEIVAHGRIADVSNEHVTIYSQQANPIISRSALRENQGKKGIIFVERVD